MSMSALSLYSMTRCVSNDNRTRRVMKSPNGTRLTFARDCWQRQMCHHILNKGKLVCINKMAVGGGSAILAFARQRCQTCLLRREHRSVHSLSLLFSLISLSLCPDCHRSVGGSEVHSERCSEQPLSHCRVICWPHIVQARHCSPCSYLLIGRIVFSVGIDAMHSLCATD